MNSFLAKNEISNVLEEFKRIIKENSDTTPSFYLNEGYFSDLTKIIEDKEYNDINKLSEKYIFLAEEFTGFIVEHEINHDQITKSILDHMKKYVIFDETQEQEEIDESVSDIDSKDEDISDANTDSDSENEDISDTDSNDKIKESIINSKNKDISDTDNNDKIKESIVNNEGETKESVINNEIKESIINNEGETKESIIYDLIKKVGNVSEKSTINNNEELINNTLKTINTLTTNISLKEQSKIGNNFKELNKIDKKKQITLKK